MDVIAPVALLVLAVLTFGAGTVATLRAMNRDGVTALFVWVALTVVVPGTLLGIGMDLLD